MTKSDANRDFPLPSPSAEIPYPGQELDLFSRATGWKSYFGQRIRPYIGGAVLEVGAGLGANLEILCDGNPAIRSYAGLEPDPDLHRRLTEKLQSAHSSPIPRSAILGTLATLPPDQRFDTLLYLDVLEHIEDDHAEFQRACDRLSPGGHLIILCPAHQWLFSPFDQAIGHFRRHNLRSFRAFTHPSVHPVRIHYLDSVGLLASSANRLLLKQSMPTEKQIRLWDRVMVPLSRWLDPLVFHQLGKSVLGVWKRDPKN
jgi:SAM-dependent methyltransferase